jgi:hypothetical protein
MAFIFSYTLLTRLMLIRLAGFVIIALNTSIPTPLPAIIAIVLEVFIVTPPMHLIMAALAVCNVIILGSGC